MAKTRGQAKPKRQPKQPAKYDPAKPGRQHGEDPRERQLDQAACGAVRALKATGKQASKIRAAWEGKAFREACPGTKKLQGAAGAGAVLIGTGV
jgi:hypothetical protein